MMKTSIHTVNSKSMVIDNGVIVKDENIKAIYDEVNDNLALEATINGNTYYKKLGMDGIINLLNNPSSPLSLEESPGIGIEKLSKNVSSSNKVKRKNRSKKRESKNNKTKNKKKPVNKKKPANKKKTLKVR